MKINKHFIYVLLVALLLSSCGHKGNLYLPEEKNLSDISEETNSSIS